ncbi:MAG: putative end-binding protein Ku [Actinomycetia bacterium]|nr:putative end-binding protein Ku [Actinomycetes bacterium]
MPRAIWKGSISFGLVNVPIGLFSATKSKTVQFHQLDRKSKKRVHNKRVVDGSSKDIDFDEVVKGYEVTKGHYVVVEPKELESVEPGASRTIDIEDFVDIADIDPVQYDKSYYLAPESGRGADKAYALLREAMHDAGRVAIGRFVLRSKQYLACIRPSGDVLVLHTMWFPDEVRDSADLDIPGKVKLTPKERKAAEQLIESLTSDWDPDRYHDTYRERVEKLLKAKAKGKAIAVEPREEREPVSDLMAALEASVTDLRSRRAGKQLGTLSKAELLKKAGAAGIEGRSKMSKGELAEALGKAS